MTNLEKLIQVLGETFPDTKFENMEIKDVLKYCTFLDCDECKFKRECDTNGGIDFWNEDYILRDLKPEPDDDIVTGYFVMVDDEGNQIPYSGCIHPTYSHAMDEMDQAEYRGWTTSIQAVKFRLVAKGGVKECLKR